MSRLIPAAESRQEQAGEPDANDAPGPGWVSQPMRAKKFPGLSRGKCVIIFCSFPPRAPPRSQCWSVLVGGLQVEPEQLRIPPDRAGPGTVATGGQHSLTLSTFSICSPLFSPSFRNVFHLLHIYPNTDSHFSAHGRLCKGRRVKATTCSWMSSLSQAHSCAYKPTQI